MKLGDILQSWRGDNAVRRGVQAADDWSNEQLQYLLGPQGYGALSGATALAREVTPAADFRDYVDYGGRAVESAREGDAAGALGNAGWAGLATLGAVLPGSAAMVDDITGALRREFPDVDFVLSGRGDAAELNKIVVPKDSRGKGVGTAFMNRLAELADQSGKTLSLDPSGDFGGSPSRLRKFYERFGFLQNKGRNRDFSISRDMYRRAMDK